jgi:hypothetical protein
VAADNGIGNDHAARMRYHRLKLFYEGIKPGKKPRVNKSKDKGKQFLGESDDEDHGRGRPSKRLKCTEDSDYDNDDLVKHRKMKLKLKTELKEEAIKAEHIKLEPQSSQGLSQKDTVKIEPASSLASDKPSHTINQPFAADLVHQYPRFDTGNSRTSANGKVPKPKVEESIAAGQVHLQTFPEASEAGPSSCVESISSLAKHGESNSTQPKIQVRSTFSSPENPRSGSTTAYTRASASFAVHHQSGPISEAPSVGPAYQPPVFGAPANTSGQFGTPAVSPFGLLSNVATESSQPSEYQFPASASLHSYTRQPAQRNDPPVSFGQYWQ